MDASSTENAADETEFILLGDALRQEGINQQTQYASRHLTGVGEAALLSEGLRYDLSGFANGGDYHSIRIHPDDAAEFARRLRAHYSALGVKV